ncbi:MAG: host attachment protein [Bacteroidota bacterium]|nr:host attachment protein [Bacteroidota bacterium]MDP4230982.1 host attachment protein [Bacteroidota bacterium]MDP4235289.1 host attachment protein [Bacteroidota bacterium]
MKSYIVIVADSGIMKAFSIRERSLIHKGKAELIKRTIYTAAHKKLSEQLSDRRGSFRGSGDARSARHGSGEAHKMMEEMEKKSLQALAHDIEGVILHTPADEYYLALPKHIYNGVTTAMKGSILSKIKKTLTKDLTKDSVEDIRKRFVV